MSLINIISIPTSHGIKNIEIHNEDITSLPWKVDLLVISAFRNAYRPSPGTVIESLEKNQSVSVNELSKNPLIDLRDTLNCFISKEFSNQSFRHLVCVEGISERIFEGKKISSKLFSDLFGIVSLLNYKGINTTTLAMPLLGTGNQAANPELVTKYLVEKSIHALRINPNLQTIYFVEKSEERAILIDETINKLQKRSKDQLELVFGNEETDRIFNDILKKLIIIQSIKPNLEENDTFLSLIGKINNKNLRFVELAILVRKLLELLLSENKEKTIEQNTTLFQYIMDLKSKTKTANWMISYIHTLREFGNYISHEHDSNMIPDCMDKEDIIVYTYSLNRFLDYYISFINNEACQK